MSDEINDVEMGPLETHPEYQALQERYGAINGLYAEISRTGLVSRDQAQQIVERCGEEVLNGRPLNSFTQIASSVNVNIAQEGLLSSARDYVWNMIKTAVKFLVDLIKDLLAFLREWVGVERKVQSMIKTMRAVNKFTGKVEPSAAPIVESHPAVVAEKQQYDEAVKSYSAGYNELMGDWLGQGNLVKLCQALSDDALQLAPAILDRANEFEDVLKRITAPQPIAADDSARMIDRLKAITAASEGRRVSNALNNSPYQLRADDSEIVTGNSAFSQQASAITRRVSDFIMMPSKEQQVEWQSAFNLIVTDKFFVERSPSISVRSYEGTLNQAYRTLQKYQSMMTHRELDPELQDAIVHAFHSIRKDLMGALSAIMALVKYNHELGRFFQRVTAASIAHAKLLKARSEAADSNNGKLVQDAMRELQRDI